MPVVNRRTFVKGMAAMPLVAPALVHAPATMAQGGTIRVGSKRAEQLQRVAQPVGDPLEHGPDQRSAIVAHGEWAGPQPH